MCTKKEKQPCTYAYASAQDLHTHIQTHIHPCIHPCMHAYIHTCRRTNIHPRGVCLLWWRRKKGCQECSEFRDIGVSGESGLGFGDSGVSGIAGSILEPQNSSCRLFMFRVWEFLSSRAKLAWSHKTRTVNPCKTSRNNSTGSRVKLRHSAAQAKRASYPQHTSPEPSALKLSTETCPEGFPHLRRP